VAERRSLRGLMEATRGKREYRKASAVLENVDGIVYEAIANLPQPDFETIDCTDDRNCIRAILNTWNRRGSYMCGVIKAPIEFSVVLPQIFWRTHLGFFPEVSS